MTLSFRESREGSREYQGENTNNCNCIRACGDRPSDREPVKQPDWDNKENQHYARNDHRCARRNSISIIIINVAVAALVFGCLWRVLDRYAKV